MVTKAVDGLAGLNAPGPSLEGASPREHCFAEGTLTCEMNPAAALAHIRIPPVSIWNQFVLFAFAKTAVDCKLP